MDPDRLDMARERGCRKAVATAQEPHKQGDRD
jgi:hypothetical protein